MSGQNEMIKQLELLRSMYEFQEYGSDIFAQRYIEICNIMAKQIDPSSFIIRGDYTPLIRGFGVLDFGEKNQETILNQFEIIDAKNYQEFFNLLWSSIDDKWLREDPLPESPDSHPSCNDTIDNDFDKLIDLNDKDCF